MDSIQQIMVALTVGATIGIIISGIRGYLILQRKNKASGNPPGPQKSGGFIMWFFSRSLYIVLGVALVWTVYFMILGLADASQSEHAANAATLIVSVVTVFSIMIAFYEFTQRKDSGKDK